MNTVSFLLSDKYDKKEMKYAMISSVINKIEVNVIGLGKPWNWDFLNKIYWISECLEKYEKSEDILLFLDSYDTFYLSNLDKIKEKFLKTDSKILFSAEACYSHQLEEDKLFYDNISYNFRYKYLNTGCCVGFGKELFIFYKGLLEKVEKDKLFMEEIRKLKPHNHGIDQTIISHYIAQNYNNYKVKLDYNCDVFYVACCDWHQIENYVDKDMKIKETNSYPCVFHVPFKGRYSHILDKLFLRKYKLKIF